MFDTDPMVQAGLQDKSSRALGGLEETFCPTLLTELGHLPKVHLLDAQLPSAYWSPLGKLGPSDPGSGTENIPMQPRVQGPSMGRKPLLPPSEPFSLSEGQEVLT